VPSNKKGAQRLVALPHPLVVFNIVLAHLRQPFAICEAKAVLMDFRSKRDCRCRDTARRQKQTPCPAFSKRRFEECAHLTLTRLLAFPVFYLDGIPMHVIYQNLTGQNIAPTVTS